MGSSRVRPRIGDAERALRLKPAALLRDNPPSRCLICGEKGFPFVAMHAQIRFRFRFFVFIFLSLDSRHLLHRRREKHKKKLNKVLVRKNSAKNWAR